MRMSHEAPFGVGGGWSASGKSESRKQKAEMKLQDYGTTDYEAGQPRNMRNTRKGDQQLTPKRTVEGPILDKRLAVAESQLGRGRLMKAELNLLVSLLLLLCACSQPRPVGAQSAVESIKPGEDSQWTDNYVPGIKYVLCVGKRSGNAVEDVRIIMGSGSSATTFTATTGTLSPGPDSDSVELLLSNVRYARGEQWGILQIVPVHLHR
jgi:hypothetical protein